MAPPPGGFPLGPLRGHVGRLSRGPKYVVLVDLYYSLTNSLPMEGTVGRVPIRLDLGQERLLRI